MQSRLFGGLHSHCVAAGVVGDLPAMSEFDCSLGTGIANEIVELVLSSHCQDGETTLAGTDDEFLSIETKSEATAPVFCEAIK